MTNSVFEVKNGAWNFMRSPTVACVAGALAAAWCLVAQFAFADVDAVNDWPSVVPETWKTNALVTFAKVPAGCGVKVLCRGATCEPRKAKGGDVVRLSCDYCGPVPACPFKIWLKAFSGECVRWDEWLDCGRDSVVQISERIWRLSFDYKLPVCLDTCRLRIHIESPSISRHPLGAEPDAELQYERLPFIPGCEVPHSSSIVQVGDTPQFALDGNPFYALWGTVNWDGRVDFLPKHSAAPLNLVTVWTKHLKWWPKGDVFEPADLDRLAEKHLRAHPDAMFMWDISIYPPPDWRDAHPEEMTRTSSGAINTDCGDAEINYSFASTKAYADMEKMLEKVIRYLESSPYANKIYGYRINSGHTVEWLGWDCTVKGEVLDFSPVAQRAYERFAKKYYPAISEFSVPTLSERRALDSPGWFLWEQNKHLRTISYFDLFSRLTANGAIRMCRKAKAILGGRKIVGTYYGYVATLYAGGTQMRAHYALKRVLDSGAMDFLLSPQDYSIRNLGDTCADMKPFRAIQERGIVSAIEEDTRTHNIPSTSHMQMKTERQSVGALRRNMGIRLCRGEPYYTYGICGGNEFDFPAFANDAAILKTLGEHCIKKQVRRRAEVAVIISEESIKGMPMLYGNGTDEEFNPGSQVYDKDGKVVRHEHSYGTVFAGYPYREFHGEVARLGVPVDYLLAEDLENVGSQYKIYIFNVCNKASQSFRRAVGKLRDRKCVLVWSHAPGYLSDDGNSLVKMKELTSVDFALCEGLQLPNIKLRDGTLTAVSNRKAAPFFTPITPGGEILGTYESTDRPAFVSYRTGASETIFFGAHLLQRRAMEEIVKRGGVHVFCCSGDPIEANERLFTLHARNAGMKKVRLPKKTDVIDVFNRKIIARGVDVFEFNAPLHSSWLFYYGDDAVSVLKEL